MIRRPVRTGTRRSHGDILNVEARSSEKSAVIAASGVSCKRLTVRNIRIDITNEGTVVIIMNRMCVNKGVPDEDEARTVVSERGETLSPKYAPEMIAPAIHPGSYP